MEPENNDKLLKCVDCKTSFIWTEGEQEFLNKLVDEGSIQELIPPKRCHPCKEARSRKFNRN